MDKKQVFKDFYIPYGYEDSVVNYLGYEDGTFIVEFVMPSKACRLEMQKPEGMSFDDFSESEELEHILNETLREIKIRQGNYS